jgi:O-methyltransferase involved in polyketide biosynthesis
MANTDITRWQKNVSETPEWDSRNVIMASHIRANDIIWDFGAGHQSIRMHKPQSARYVPIDCVAKTPDTVICDFNHDFILPSERPTLVIMSGFLEYILEPDDFLQRLRKELATTRALFSWAHLPEAPDERAKHGWISPLVVDHRSPEYFGRHFADLERFAVWGRGTALYKGRLRSI